MALVHLGLMLALPVVLGGLVGLGLWLRARATTRRAARRARQLIQSGSDAEQGIEVLRGRLRVPGDPVEQVQARGKVGAATAWLSPGRALWSADAHHGDCHRAPSLVIEAGDREIGIDETVVVKVGSAMRWLGKRAWTGEGYATLAWATVVDGDEIVARGRIVTKVREGTAADEDYRSAASHEVLMPVAAESVVELAALAGPGVHLTAGQARRHPLAILTALVACYFPFGALQDYAELDCGSLCADFGTCDITPLWRHSSARYALKHMLFSDHFRCEAARSTDCRASEVCADLGYCTAQDGVCTVVTRADCLHLTRCLTAGACSPHEGSCQAEGDDCLHTTACLDEGRCFGVDGFCVATTEEHCAASQDCATQGRCTLLDDGRCGATRDEHCAATKGCREGGACKASDAGDCVLTDEVCGARSECRADGQCHAGGSFCRATSNADCAQSRGCAEYRRCVLGKHVCSEEDAPTCRPSAACKIHGHCGGGAVCKAVSEADCKASQRCATHGECRLMNGTCMKSCQASWGCRRRGWCTERDGRCVAGSDTDCAASDDCKADGWCSEDNGQCRVLSSADCLGTSGCRFRGACTPQGSSCRIAGDAGCRRTLDCQLQGHCTYQDGRCVAAGDDCRSTRACQEWGDCTAIDGKCRVGSNADCQAAAVCERNGWCERLPVEGLWERANACFVKPPR